MHCGEMGWEEMGKSVSLVWPIDQPCTVLVAHELATWDLMNLTAQSWRKTYIQTMPKNCESKGEGYFIQDGHFLSKQVIFSLICFGE